MPALRIVDTSPLVFLSRVGLLEVRLEGGSRVVVPDSVLAEVHAKGPFDATVQAIGLLDWIEVVPTPAIPESVIRCKLDPGESAVLALALTYVDCELILDDRDARACARSLGMLFSGTLGMVLTAKRLGMVPLARPVIEELYRSGMYLSDAVLAEALAQVGESW